MRQTVVIAVPVTLARFIHVQGGYQESSSGERIRAIKAFREVSRVGLKEAKFTVDALTAGDFVEDGDIALVMLPSSV